MRRDCVYCGAVFTDDYRGWFDKYLLHVCSGDCFRDVAKENTGDASLGDWTEFKEPKRLRSDYERRLFQFLRALDVGFDYERYYFTMSNGSRYVPDFLIETSFFIEVKGLWKTEAKKKFLEFTKTYDTPIYVMDLKSIRRLNIRRAQ